MRRTSCPPRKPAGRVMGGTTAFRCPVGGQSQREVAVVSVSLWGLPILASGDSECPKSETQASGPLRKPQEVLIYEPEPSPVLDLSCPLSFSPTRLLGCALSHGYHRGCLPGPSLPPGLHVCWTAPWPPQVGEGASLTTEERVPEGLQR